MVSVYATKCLSVRRGGSSIHLSRNTGLLNFTRCTRTVCPCGILDAALREGTTLFGVLSNLHIVWPEWRSPEWRSPDGGPAERET